MNLNKQLGNLFISGFRGTHILAGSQLEHELVTHTPGGVILFDRCVSDPSQPGNIESPKQLKKLVSRLHELSPSPLLVCVDQEGGLVQRLNDRNGFSSTASAEEMGNRDSEAFTAAQSRTVSEALFKMGINVNFAPVADLNKNSSNPIIGAVKRAFSPSPATVVRHARTWIKAHSDNNVVSCLKHFPGHGSSAEDSHLGFVDISHSWDNDELIPYRTLVATEPIQLIMVGHLYNKNIDSEFPASLSQKTVTKLLRHELGYNGVIVTDDMHMKAITSRYGFAEAICRSISAGVDMIIVGNNIEYNPNILTECINAVQRGINQGIVSERVVTAALGRIQDLKKSLQGEISGHDTTDP